MPKKQSRTKSAKPRSRPGPAPRTPADDDAPQDAPVVDPPVDLPPAVVTDDRESEQYEQEESHVRPEISAPPAVRRRKQPPPRVVTGLTEQQRGTD